MKTTLELTNQELSELKELTRQTDAAIALHTALVEFIRYAKRMRLKELSGKIKMEDNWRKLEQLEMDAQNGRTRSR